MTRHTQARASREEIAIGGRRAVLEAIRAGRARRVLLARGARATPGLRELIAEAERSAVPMREADRADLDARRVVDHQGVVAVVGLPSELDERALTTFDFGPDALAVVLDGITDPQNLGACARSAEAAGAALLVAGRRRAAPASAAAVRASAGALLHLPVVRVPNLTRAIERLKDRGFTIVGLDHRAEATIHDAEPPARPLAIVVGSEGEGMSRLVRKACDVVVSIPLAGRTGSLNASVALAVSLFGYALRSPRAG